MSTTSNSPDSTWQIATDGQASAAAATPGAIVLFQPTPAQVKATMQAGVNATAQQYMRSLEAIGLTRPQVVTAVSAFMPGTLTPDQVTKLGGPAQVAAAIQTAIASGPA